MYKSITLKLYQNYYITITILKYKITILQCNQSTFKLFFKFSYFLIYSPALVHGLVKGRVPKSR